MRQMHRGILIAALAAGLAGCASVQVGGPVTQDAAPPAVSTHWTFDQARPAAQSDGYRPPRKLAVLLPMTGTLATAAAPVRDGLLAGYYAERRERPELVFYDTATGATAAHARAVAEGADQILGPLGREEVTALFQSMSGPPLIALNRGTGPLPPNTTSYSLAPEDDGAAIADHLAERNARNVLVLSNGDDNAQRVLAVLRERLQAAGGSADVLSVAGDAPELTEAMRAAASKDGGVDAVVLAIRGNQARLLAPQLFAAGLGDRLRIATAQISLGTGRTEEDRVLDGIVFPTESWVAGQSGPLPPAAGVGQTLPTARGPAARLFAVGYDAWLLSGYLDRMASRPGTQLNGVTGVLQMDAAGNLQRKPAWAVWRGGMVVPHSGP